MERVFYTPREVAVMLGVRKDTVYVMLANGEIPAIKIGNRYKVPKEQFHDWLRTQSELQASERQVESCN